MDTVNIETIKLDGKTYGLTDIIENYYYLVNIDDQEDLFINKKDGDNIVNLDTDAEFDEALKLYMKKHSK